MSFLKKFKLLKKIFFNVGFFSLRSSSKFFFKTKQLLLVIIKTIKNGNHKSKINLKMLSFIKDFFK